MLSILWKTSLLMLHTDQIIFSLLCLLLILLAFIIINAKRRATMYYTIKIVIFVAAQYTEQISAITTKGGLL